MHLLEGVANLGAYTSRANGITVAACAALTDNPDAAYPQNSLLARLVLAWPLDYI